MYVRGLVVNNVLLTTQIKNRDGDNKVGWISSKYPPNRIARLFGVLEMTAEASEVIKIDTDVQKNIKHQLNLHRIMDPTNSMTHADAST